MPEKFVTKRGLKGDKKAVTPALGVILLMPSLLLAAMAGVVMMNNLADWSNAEADRAAFHAECARAAMDESIEPHPACFDDDWYKRVPGYHCWKDKTRVVCEKAEATISSED